MAQINPLYTKASVIESLAQPNATITSTILKDLILDDQSERLRRYDLYRKYKQKDLAIKKKDAVEGRPNNKLMHDFRGEIVDQKVGYSFGNPVTYTVNDKKMTVEAKESANDALTEFIKSNRIESLDTNLAKYMSCCGTGSRLLYINKEKKVKTMNPKPWETLFIYNDVLDTIEYAMRYWKMTEVRGAGKRSFWKVEWYDELFVSTFIELEKDTFTLEDKQQHGFKKVPLIEYPNKEERLGDFEKVETLVDFYDYVQSYSGDEIEAFRNAYLKFKNAQIDEAFLKLMKEEGGINLPEGGEAEWLIKKIDGTFVESFMNRLENDIYRFSKTVNMNDEKFSGAGQSGESRKWKLKVLEDDGTLKERAFAESAKNMFNILGDISKLFSIDLIDKIDIQFTNAIPVDLLYHADVTTKLKGNVSEKTRLAQLPFVENVDDEIAAMDEERQANIELMNEQFNNEPNNDDDEDDEE